MRNSKFRNGGDKPVVALDIDGTLGDYHGHFLRFAEGYIGKNMPDAKDINPGLPLWKHMRVSKASYRAAKLAYRQGGLKRSMPCYEGADDLTNDLRRAGAEVWICTTRPYLRLDNIDPDTREWLRRNKIKYDAVIFGETKYKELIKQVGISRIVSVADELPEQAEKAYRLGLAPIFMMDQPYNRRHHGTFDSSYDNCLDINYIVDRVYDLYQMRTEMLKWITGYNGYGEYA